MSELNNLSEQWQAARGNYLRRRWFLRDCGIGLAGVAAATLMGDEARTSTDSGMPMQVRWHPARHTLNLGPNG